MTLRRHGRMRGGFIQGCIPAFSWRMWGKQREMAVTIKVVTIVIRTTFLDNTRQNPYLVGKFSRYRLMNFYFSPLSSCVLRQTDTFLAYYRTCEIVNKKKTKKESNRLSNSMEQSPSWESNRSSAIRENSRIYAWFFQVVSFRLVSSLKSCM